MELTKFEDLLPSGLLHLLIDLLFLFHQLIILLFQILEPVLQGLDVLKLPLLSGPRGSPLTALVLHYGFEEVVEFL